MNKLMTTDEIRAAAKKVYTAATTEKCITSLADHIDELRVQMDSRIHWLDAALGDKSSPSLDARPAAANKESVVKSLKAWADMTSEDTHPGEHRTLLAAINYIDSHNEPPKTINVAADKLLAAAKAVWEEFDRYPDNVGTGRFLNLRAAIAEYEVAKKG